MSERLDEQDTGSDSDIDSLTETLEQVGKLVFPTFSILPHLPALPKLAALKMDYNSTSIAKKFSELSSSTALHFQGFTEKKDELAKLYSEMSESLTDVINSNIDYPVEDLHEPAGVEILQEPKTTVSLVKDRLASYD
ncbi:hypothetical protein OGATHE_006815, partial [Ogataea polymorpha]